MIVESKIVGIDEVHPNTYNPNAMTEFEFTSLVESIKSYGFIEAIITLPDGTIINGEHRWRAMKEIGETEIEIKVLNVSQEEAKLLTVNLDSIRGSFDQSKLGTLLYSLETEMGRENLKTKLAMSESDYRKTVKKYQDSLVSRDLPPDPGGVGDTFVQLGDIWRVGNHIMMCGDCSNPEHMTALRSHITRPTLMITDPPYGVSKGAQNRELNKIYGGNRREEDILNDTVDVDSQKTMTQGFRNIREILTEDSSYYIFTAPSHPEYQFISGIVGDAGYEIRHQLIWNKPNFPLARIDYKYRHEPILYGWGEKHNWYGTDSEVSVWDSAPSKGNKNHPTEKPVELYIRAICNSSNIGDSVIDPFSGSGTVFFACQNTNRNGIGIDISPEYVQNAMLRLEQVVGESATKLT